MLAGIFGPAIQPTSKSANTKPTGSLSATVKGNWNGKHCLVPLNEGKKKEQEQ